MFKIKRKSQSPIPEPVGDTQNTDPMRFFSSGDTIPAEFSPVDRNYDSQSLSSIPSLSPIDLPPAECINSKDQHYLASTENFQIIEDFTKIDQGKLQNRTPTPNPSSYPGTPVMSETDPGNLTPLSDFYEDTFFKNEEGVAKSHLRQGGSFVIEEKAIEEDSSPSTEITLSRTPSPCPSSTNSFLQKALVAQEDNKDRRSFTPVDERQNSRPIVFDGTISSTPPAISDEDRALEIMNILSREEEFKFRNRVRRALNLENGVQKSQTR